MLVHAAVEADMFWRAHDLACDGLRSLDGKRLGRRWHGLLLRLAARSVNSLRATHELLLNGYPVQAITLARATQEAVITGAYIHKYPRQARFWLAKKYVGKASRKIPSFAAMRQDLGGRLGKTEKEAYDLTSQFAHPRPGGLRYEIETVDGVTTLLLGARFDTQLITAAYYVVLNYAVMTNTLVGVLARGGNPEWGQCADAIDSEIASWIRTENRRLSKEKSLAKITRQAARA